MKVTQKKIDSNTVLLEAIASTEEVSRAFHVAHIGFAQQMGLHYEQGKTIAQIAEERMGIKDLDSVVQKQAVEYLMPFAVNKKNIIPAYPPLPQPKSPLKRGQTFSFELKVALKPDYELTSYDPVEFTIQKVKVSEEDVDAQIAQIAERYAEYAADDPHPIQKGDACLLAIDARKDGETLAGLTTEGRTYITGEGLMPDGFDNQIVGMDVGETKTFSFEGPDIDEQGNEISEVVECTVTVKEAQKKVLPTINDEWVAKFMPMYKSAKDFRASIAGGLKEQQRNQYEEYKRQLAVMELAKRFKGSIPDEVYEAMSHNIMNNLRAEVQQQGIKFEQFIEQQGGQQQFNMMMMIQTRQMLTQGYALDALFRHEKLIISDEDIMDACRSMNPQNPSNARKQLEDAGRGFVVREAAERMRANKWLVEHAKITEVDPNAEVASNAGNNIESHAGITENPAAGAKVERDADSEDEAKSDTTAKKSVGK